MSTPISQLTAQAESTARIEFRQQSFLGGMNQQVDGSRLAANEYPLMVNGRNRYDVITPIKMPVAVTAAEGLPEGKLQGCYAATSFLLVFVAGKAYVRDYENAGSIFVKIPVFQMSATADRIYACLVPGSTVNYQRILQTAGNPSSGVDFGAAVGGSPACVVVQDGESQPWIIMADGSARVTKNYNQWTTIDREYVPIGYQMIYNGATLYVVARDRHQLFRSVSGRSLDFMINIDDAGDKNPLEAVGGAASVSHQVSFEPISALAMTALGVQDAGIYVASNKNSYIVRPDYTNMVFGEPSFTNGYLFPTGANNNFAFIDILGDNAFIDFAGLRSFNAIAQTRNEGRNAPFSAKIFPVFKDLIQTTCCAINFDNYGLFAVNTVYGPAIVVYDTLTRNFVGLDIYPGVGFIKQFCEVRTSLARKLFFIAGDNKLYEAYAGSTAKCQLYLGEFCTNDPKKFQRPLRIRTIFTDAFESGTVTASVYGDRRLTTTGKITRSITQTKAARVYPQTVPFGNDVDRSVETVTIDIGRSEAAWKIGVLLEWDCEASLSHFELESEPQNGEANYAEQGKLFRQYITGAAS